MIIHNNLHKGNFKVSIHLIESNPKSVMMIMSDIIIVRAECMYMEEIIQYQGISEKYFDEIELGELIPDYQFIMKDDKIIANRLN